MPRARKGAARRQANKRILKRVSGHRGSAGRTIRLAKEAVVRAGVNARVGRRRKKRIFRGIWVIRVNAACKARSITYSQFINGCKKANIEINRKMLSEIAIADSAGFDAIVDAAKAALV